MDPRHPDIVDPLDRATEGFQGDGGLLGHGKIAGSRTQHPDGGMGCVHGGASQGEAACTTMVDGLRQESGDHRGLFLRNAGRQHVSLAFVDDGGDPCDLLGRLSLAEDDLGPAATCATIGIDPGKAEVHNPAVRNRITHGRQPNPRPAA